MNNSSLNKIDPIPNFRYVNQGELFKIALLVLFQQFKNSWRVYSRNRLAIFGLVLLSLFVTMAIIHPILIQTVWPKSIYDPVVGFDVKVFINPSPPSLEHPLGTDTLGRDVLSMLMAATIPSLAMTLTAALTAAGLGTIIGAFSAYFRGAVDGFFSHLSDLTMLTPAPIVMVLIGFTLNISPVSFGLIYGFLVGVGVVAIILRAHALTIVNRVFIDAARVAGGSAFHIIVRHLIPHLIPLATVNMLFTVTGAIFANGFIAFLGLSRAHLNWGSMIYDSFTYQGLNGMIPWNVLISSAMAISLFAASFYLIALGLQDVTNPRISERMVEKQPILDSVYRIDESAKTNILRSDVDKITIETEVKQKPILDQKLEMAIGKPISISPIFIDQPVKHWITVLVFEFFGSELIADNGFLNFLSNIKEDLVRRDGRVIEANEGLYVASFGLASAIPPQASVLMGVTIGIKIIEKFNEFRYQRVENGMDDGKLGIGISFGQVELNEVNESNWFIPAMTAEVGHTARTLCGFTKFMRHGGLLICENTYNYLTPVQHNIKFGRQGLAKFPINNDEKMIYEIIGYSS